MRINLSRPMIAGLLASACACAFASPPGELPAGCQTAASRAPTAAAASVLQPAFPPVQLQVRTPVAPVPLPSAGRNYLVYELHLQNFASEASSVRAIEVMVADGASTVIAEFADAALQVVLRPVGVDSGDDKRRIGAGQTTVAFLCVAFDGKLPLPAKLRHRIALDTAVADGPVVDVRRAAVPVLGRPLTGSGWNPRHGPQAGSHHRMGLFIADGLATISRRYAIDWRRSRQGEAYSGDPRDVRAYYAYGEKVLAVADGVVVVARDGMPDNIPKTEAGFALAVPLSMDTLAGNAIVIALGDGQLASYSHLQAGSVRIKAGERVKRGQVIARVGNSGDARWPHLHFQVTDKVNVMAGEGAPFVIDHYRIKAAGRDWEARAGEFPWGDAADIDFGPDPDALP